LGNLRKLLPSICMGVMGNTGIYLVPLLVGAMVADRGFTDQQAGLVASADIAGYAAATFVTAMWLIRRNWRRMALFGVAIMIAANLGSPFVSGGIAFAAVRFASGIGAGILAALATVFLGQTDQPDRNFGFLFAGCLLFGTTALWGLPLLLERFGLNGAYVLIAGLALLVGFVSLTLPQAGSSQVRSGDASFRGRGWWLVGSVLLAITLFWAQQNAIYAYAERIGNTSGLSAKFIGFALGLANLTGFAGASLVAWMGSRFGRAAPLIASTGVQLVCLWALTGHVSSPVYLTALGCLALAWNVVNPLQLGILASVDHGGRALALAGTVIGVGLAIGPALGAAVLEGSNYASILRLAVALVLASTAFAIPALRPRLRIAEATG
jgi:predicted MFS family arabinose efflux permease